jgi:S1-C subfamily serine protease
VDAQGNLVPGDIILAVAGIPIDSVAALLSALDDHRIGEQVSIRVWRSGRVAEFPVILEPGD